MVNITSIDAKYIKLLRANDEDGCYECPSDFDAHDIEQRARCVLADIKGKGEACKFESWMYHQDASFGLAIVFDQRSAKDKTGYVFTPGIRFSNFGSLVYLSGSEALPKSLVDFIYQSFQKHSFYPIPLHVLNQPYDGILQDDQRLSTWWVRYFDWI